MKKFITLLSVCLFLFTSSFSQMEIPVTKGSWWKIGDNEPDISPYTYTKWGTSSACDFTIYEDDYGKWHLIACIRNTNYPGSNRLFHEWTADSLLQTNWVEKGIFMTTGTIGSPDLIGNQMFVNTPYNVEGKLQAPHTFKYNNQYYMFHNSGGAFCLTGSDGATWNFLDDYQGNKKFFDMGRDVMIFNDLDQTGKWYAYYCTNTKVVRTADSLRGPWSSEIDLNTTGNPESPFVIRKGTNDYYLWEQMFVYYSNDPAKFEGYQITKMTPNFFAGYYAPEIVQDNGKWFVAGYNVNGIWVCEMEWLSPDLPSVNAYLTSMTVDEGALNQVFDSVLTRYSMTVPYTDSNITINTITSNPSATVTLRNNTGLSVGSNLVEVVVTTPGGVSTRIYDIYVNRLDVGQQTYTLTVNGGSGSGSYVACSNINIVADAPVYGKEFLKWTGDISYVADSSSSTTVLTMPSQAVSVTATYFDLPLHTLTVNHGTPSGDYLLNDVVEITVDIAHIDSVFYIWEGDIQTIDNPYSDTANLIMPDADVNITAKYIAKTTPLYTLSVTNGTGSGSYLPASIISIIANAPPPLQSFERWIGDNSYIDDTNAVSSFVTMPVSNVNISVKYYDAPPAPPQNISAITGDNVVNLNWDNNTEGDFNHYKVYRSETSGSGYIELDGNVTTSDYSDNTVITATTYYYVITAVDDGSNESIYSLEYTATPVAAGVIYVTSDLATNDAWRSTNVIKADDVDGDNGYGTDGYYLFVFVGGGEMKDLPAYVQSVTYGSNASTVPFGTGLPVDDPTLTPAPDLADVNPVKLDLNIADGFEGEFLTIKMAQSMNFRLGVYSGHKANEVAQSIRVLLNSNTTAQINLSTAQQYTLIDVIANAGDDIIIYGTTRTNAQSRNAISGIFFDSNFDALPSTPANLSAIAGDGTVALDWDDNIEGDFSHYKIYRSTTSGGGFTVLDGNVLVSNYTDNSVTNGIIYYYVLKAVDTALGESGYSTEVSANPVAPTYTLTVNSGSGSGSYEAGGLVNITAGTAATCEEFTAWTGDVTNIASTTSVSTTITMPAAATVITATYSSLPDYTLTVINGTGGGDYCETSIVAITAATAPLDCRILFNSNFVEINKPEITGVNYHRTLINDQ